MLVLRRKKGEKILLSGNILIEMLEVHEGRAKLGITAPPEVDIVREEIVRRHHLRKSFLARNPSKARICKSRH